MNFKKSIEKVGKLPISKILPGHHKLDVDTSLIEKIGQAFGQIIGNALGIYKFDKFSIHI